MDIPTSSLQDAWEYKVIHLNVEPGPAAAAPGPPAAGTPTAGEESGQARPMFSDSFLKKEFPRFYDSRLEQERAGQPQPQPQPQHPAQQLQAFLHDHGAQGWQLVGVFPVGVLSMLFFRRPKPLVVPPAAPGAAQHDRDALLQAVLARLAAIEQSLAAGASHPAGGSPASSPAPRPRDGDRVSASQLAALGAEPLMPSSAAARAIGLRSAASLSNHGARHGYQPGLCKHGPNGMVALYSGSAEPERGGKARRLWIVVPATRLRP